MAEIPFKLPPQNTEAEQSFLGAVLLDNTVLKRVNLSAEAFYKPCHKAIFEALHVLYQAGEPIDIITLSDALKTTNKLDLAGGMQYLTQIAITCSSAVNAAYYAGIIREKSARRNFIKACGEGIEAAYAEDDITDLLHTHKSRVQQISLTGDQVEDVHIKEVVIETFKFLEWRHEHRDKISGITSGIKEMDDITDGWQNGNLIIIGGRPSQGKSVMGMNLVRNSGVPCGAFHLEMSDKEIGLREIAGAAQIELKKLQKGFIGKGDWHHLSEAAGNLAGKEIYFTFKTLDLTSIERKAVDWVENRGVKLLMIDYLQLARVKGISNREQQIAEVTRTLKGIAKAYNIPVIALSQLNRSTEKEKRRPNMSDLRESGAIENDADVIILLHRPKEDENITEAIVCKGRNVGSGLERLYFDKPRSTFRSLDDRQEEAF